MIIPIVGELSPGTTGERIQTTVGTKLADLPHIRHLDSGLRREMEVVAAVLPFKVNNYVLNELIDWAAVPNDPIFRLTFPNREMLPSGIYDRAVRLIEEGGELNYHRSIIDGLRRELDPYLDDKPARNRPSDDAGPIDGLMHK